MTHHKTQYIKAPLLWWSLLVALCVIASVTVIFVNPLFVIAAVFVLINVFLILKYPMYGLIIYLIIFLIRPGELFPALAALRVELLVGSFTLLATILNQKFITGKILWPMDPITLCMLGMLTAIALSILTSYEKSASTNWTIDFVKIVIFYYLIVCNLTTQKRFVTFMTVFVLLITYIALDALRNYLAGTFIHTMNVDRLTGSTSAGGDPNTLASTMSATIPLIVAMLYYFRRFILKIGMGALTLTMIALIAITASRGGLVSFLGVVAAAISYTRQKLLYTICVAVLLVVGWIVLPQQYKARYERFSEVTTDINKSSSGRWEIWQAGIQMIAQHPLLGTGAGAFPWAYNSGEFGPPQWMDPHNLYIQVFASTGLIGSAMWITFLYFYIRTLRRMIKATQEDEEHRWINIFANGILVSLVALFISGMFGHTLFRYTWYMMAGLTAAMHAMLNAETNETVTNENPDQSETTTAVVHV